LIFNPDAGNASEAANALKLVTGYLKKNGLESECGPGQTKSKSHSASQASH